MTEANKYYYVAAGTYEQARAFARERKIPPSRLRYVFEAARLHGLREGTIFIVGTARFRDDFFEIERIALERGFKLEDV